MKLDYSGRTVLITGATRGIGAAIAEEFESAGASLILTGTDEVRIDELNRDNIQRRRNHIQWLQLDFGDTNSLASFISQIERVPYIDVLINNAGSNILSPIDEISSDDLECLMSINLTGPLLLCKAVAPSMKKAGYGRIVNIASIWSVISKPGRVMYSASKAGLSGGTRAVAADLGPHGVLVNTLSPGFVETELTKSTLSDQERSELERQVPVGRFANPHEIAKVALFLASEQNTYVTGQNIVADGGYVCI